MLFLKGNWSSIPLYFFYRACHLKKPLAGDYQYIPFLFIFIGFNLAKMSLPLMFSHNT